MFVRAVVPAETAYLAGKKREEIARTRLLEESWAHFLPDSRPASPSPRQNPWDGCEPASRPLPCPEPATGELGPGAYSTNASLTQPTVRCGALSKAERFPSEVKAGDALLRRREAAIEALAAGSDDPQQAFHNVSSSPSNKRTLWASTSDSCLSSPTGSTTSKVYLGKPMREKAFDMSFEEREAEMVRAQARLREQAAAAQGKEVPTHSSSEWGPNMGTQKRRPPINGHPGKLQKMKMTVQTQKKNWDTLSLFGGTVGTQKMPRPRRGMDLV